MEGLAPQEGARNASKAGRPARPSRARNKGLNVAFTDLKQSERGFPMRSILLLFLGVPLPIILLLAFCTHHF